MAILNWLKKPYYFVSDPKLHLILSIIIGSFIFLFIYTFKPFGMSALENNLFFYSLGFGVVSFCVQTFVFIIIPLFFKDFFKNEKWTIGKNILFLLILITLIAICNWYYNSYYQNTEKHRLLTFNEMFFYTFSIAVFPIFLYTFFSEKINRTKREKTSKEIMNFRVSTSIKEWNEEIKIIGDNKKETINFNIEDLVYITSQGNYASFFLYTNNTIEEKILRKTLTNITLDINKYSTITRCHKSYIANSKYMDSISGNARGYFLESSLLNIQIPVSRGIKKEELKKLIC
jgi:hypothetical protein